MGSQVVPAGFKTGCLPRKSLCGARFPLASDRIEVISQSRWKEFTGKVSLRPYVKTILNQGNVGSCATEATAQAIMILRAYLGLPHVVLNPWFIYYHTSGGRDQGSSIDDNLAFVLEYGCAPESVWPRSKGWQAKPSKEAYAAALDFRPREVFDITSISEMVSAELKADAVVYGSNGHAVVKIEHQDDNTGLDVNSWGTGWEDGGFGEWASYNQVQWQYGAYALRF